MASYQINNEYDYGNSNGGRNDDYYDEKTQMAQRYIEKRLKRGKIFIGVMISILALIILSPIICFGAINLFFDTNLFSFVSEVKDLNKFSELEYNLNLPSKFTQKDETSYLNKVSGNSTNSVYLITDKEIGAYIAEDLDSDDKIVLKKNLELEGDSDFELVQIDLFNTYLVSTPNHLSDLNIVVKLDLDRFKENEFTKFPVSMINKYIPSSVYLSINSEIILNEDGSYGVVYNDITINNLNSEDSEKLLNSVCAFSKIGKSKINKIKVARSNQFSTLITGFFVDKILGDSEKSVISTFTSKGAKSYSFYSDDSSDYFIAYEHSKDETATINYYNTKDLANPNVTQYNILYNYVNLQDLSTAGYKFLGWFDGDGDGASRVNGFNAWNLQNLNLYAKWEIIEYKIEYYFGSGSLVEDSPTTYNIESELKISPATKEKDFEINFLGWTFKYKQNGETVPGYDDPDTGLLIKRGTYGDLMLYARFDDERVLTLYIDGSHGADMTIILGETFTQNDIEENIDFEQIGFAGYSVSKWYTDKELENEYDYSTIVREDMKLYGESEYFIQQLEGTNYKILFYPYIDEFNEAISQKKLVVDSYEKLFAIFQYNIFYDIETEIELEITYSSNSWVLDADVERITDSIIYNQGFMTYFRYWFSKLPSGNYYFKVETLTENFASKTADPKGKETYDQVKNIFTFTDYKTNRSDDYDDFKINKISKELRVSTSMQLGYALEQGFRPVCEPGSIAETLYNEAKRILRKICDDSMTDLQKIKAMYDWLCENVQYDHKAFDMGEAGKETIQYKSHYMEGVFIDHIAVCDGYARSFVMLAKIEGIPMIVVIGDRHAWNKVLLDGVWYGIDATHGDGIIRDYDNNYYEAITYDQFLFTDSYKTEKGYTSIYYPEIDADKQLCYYKNLTFTYGEKEFDLYIESEKEFKDVVNIAIQISRDKNIRDFCIEIELGRGLDIYSLRKLVNVSNKEALFYTGTDTDGVELLVILFLNK